MTGPEKIPPQAGIEPWVCRSRGGRLNHQVKTRLHTGACACIQNSAARLICKSPWSQPCSPLLKKLHWLPVEERIIYKCCCLCFKVLTGDAPAYLSDLLHVYVPSRTLRSSADTRIFRLPNHRPNRKQHGERAFSYAAVHHWNNLPYTVRHSQSFSTFKTSLKTHLFSKHFC